MIGCELGFRPSNRFVGLITHQCLGKPATSATFLGVNDLRCNITRNKPATALQHFHLGGRISKQFCLCLVNLELAKRHYPTNREAFVEAGLWPAMEGGILPPGPVSAFSVT